MWKKRFIIKIRQPSKIYQLNYCSVNQAAKSISEYTKTTTTIHATWKFRWPTFEIVLKLCFQDNILTKRTDTFFLPPNKSQPINKNTRNKEIEREKVSGNKVERQKFFLWMFSLPAEQEKTIERKKEIKSKERPSKIECELSLLEGPYQKHRIHSQTHTGQFSPNFLNTCAHWRCSTVTCWLNERRWQYCSLCNR